MSDWKNLDEEWWDNAYKLFLESEPITMTLKHVAFYLSGQRWNDYGTHMFLPPGNYVVFLERQYWW